MATVHLGRLLGPVGFSRTVAIKRLHAQFASDPEFVSMFLDEARLAARIRIRTWSRPSTSWRRRGAVPRHGLRAGRVRRASCACFASGSRPSRPHLSAVMSGALHGLHAAHEAKTSEVIRSASSIVTSPRRTSSRHGRLAPRARLRRREGGRPRANDARRADQGQARTCRRSNPRRLRRSQDGHLRRRRHGLGAPHGPAPLAGDNEGAVVAKVLEGRVEPPSQVLMRSRRMTLTDVTMRQLEGLDQTILKALSMDPAAAIATAREMAIEIERRLPPATASECAGLAREHRARRPRVARRAHRRIESSASHVVDESHIMSVLNAKATLGPSSSLVTNRNSSSRTTQERQRQYPGRAPVGAPAQRDHGHAAGAWAPARA